MKQLLLILLLLTNIGVAQTIQTHATDFFYIYPDSTLNTKGECYMELIISSDSIYLGTAPPLTLRVLQTDPIEELPEGKLLNMWCRDKQGNGTLARLLISPEQNELHVIYQNVTLAYIFE